MKFKIAKIFNEYFVNTVKNLGILTEMGSATFTENNLIKVEIALKKYKNHPSNFAFSFKFTSHDDIVKELNKLKTKTDINMKLSRKM